MIPVSSSHLDDSPKADWYATGVAVLREKHAQNRCSEADVSRILIGPCLESVLNYSKSSIDAEASMDRKRPDYLCRRKDGNAEVIVEVKNLTVSLTKRISFQAAWHTSPYGQITRYLEKYPISQDGTWGILTNGEDWIILRRNGQDVEQIKSVRAVRLADVDRILAPIRNSITSHLPRVLDASENEKSIWLELLQDPALTPLGFLHATRPQESESIIEERGHGFALIGKLPPLHGELLSRSVWLACLQLDLPDGHLAPPDITEELRPFVKSRGSFRIYGIAYWKRLDGETRCRGFLWQ